jgi:hypothetical protein
VGAIVLLVRFISYWSFLVFSGLVTVVGGFGSLLPSAFAAATGPATGGPATGGPATDDRVAGQTHTADGLELR